MKFRFLDGLRGIAALVVVFDHFTFAFLPYTIAANGVRHHMGEAIIHRTPLYLLVDGDFSVCIFFVLSGIVLSAKFFRTGDDEAIIASAVKRYLRLALPVLGSILLAYAAMKFHLFHNVRAGEISGSPWYSAFWQFPAHFSEALYQATQGVFLTQNNTYNPVLWTMNYEFLGSFLIFLTLLVFGKLRNRAIAYGFLVIIFLQTDYLAFVLGMIACDYYFNGRRSGLRARMRRGYWLPLGVAALIVGSYPFGSTEGSLFQNYHLPIIAAANLPSFLHIMGAFALIIAIMSSTLLKRLLTTRPMLFLGRISFSLYLIHFLILGSYTGYLFNYLSGMVGYRTSVILTFIPTIVLSITAAYLYTKYVDEPATRFAGYVYTRLFKRAPPKIDAATAPTVQAQLSA